MQGWMNAREAAEHLGVSRQTLYAYVSRGLLRADDAGAARHSRYRRAEVERLAAQRSGARNPKQAARTTLDWGLPVLGSSLTLIRDGRLHYRGQDALALAGHATLEDVAALLWGCDAADVLADGVGEPSAAWLAPLRASPALPHTRCSLAAFHALLARHQVEVAHWNAVPAAGAQLLRWMRAATTLRALPAAARREPLHGQLQAVWHQSAAAAEMLRAALVLCADHELNASSFTVRCVASTGASLDACVAAGLAALSGARHGGATATVEARWDGWMALPRARRSLREAVTAVLAPAAGAPADIGFGHLLYPDGDPRAQALLARLPPHAARDRFIAEVHALTGLRPSVDFALVALRRHLGLPLGAAFALFAIGRTVGWIAHALEQREAGALIRPRAAYVGVMPDAASDVAPLRGRVIRRR